MTRLLDLFRPLWRRLFPRRRSPLEFTLYTRRGCHLCDDAHAELRRQQERHGFALTIVDVDTDPRLVAEHGAWVPVVVVNGKPRFRGRVNPVLLARLLRGEADRTWRVA